MKPPRILPIVAVLSASLLALAGCTPDPSADPSNTELNDDVTIAVVDEAAALVPASIRQEGTLKVAIPTNEPPTQYYEEGTEELIGINPSTASLVADALDLELEIHVTNFDSIIPGIEAKRYDMSVSSMTPTEERMKTLDFVDYMRMGNSLAVPSGNPDNLTLNSLCGRKVAVLTGSYQLTARVPEMTEKCETAGKEPIQIEQFKDTRQAITALISNRVAGVFADSPILGFAASQNSSIEISDSNDFDQVGIGISKESKLVDAVKPAMDEILKSDQYKNMLDNYGQEDGTITDAKLNHAQ